VVQVVLLEPLEPLVPEFPKFPLVGSTGFGWDAGEAVVAAVVDTSRTDPHPSRDAGDTL
jgi:hypothetical protein